MAVAPSLRAAARDLSAFRSARGYRAIPLSYSAADVASLRLLTAHYLTCASAGGATINLLGLNIFDECAPADWTSLHGQFRDFNVPVVISEAGCRASSAGNRSFADVALLLRSEMDDVFSGVNVFEWVMEDTHYGLVEYPDAAHTGTPTTMPWFGTLASVYSSAAASQTGTARDKYLPTNAEPACPTVDAAAGWTINTKAPLPSIAGLDVGTVTAVGGARVTGTSSVGQGRLSTGAIAGIVAACVGGVVAFVVGVGLCLRRRRAKLAQRSREQAMEMEGGARSSCTYPRDKAELPEDNMAAFEMEERIHASEMEAWPQSATTTAGSEWTVQEARDDSPTVTEVPSRSWKRATVHELEDNSPGAAGRSVSVTTDAEAERKGEDWEVSPLSPESKQT